MQLAIHEAPPTAAGGSVKLQAEIDPKLRSLATSHQRTQLRTGVSDRASSDAPAASLPYDRFCRATSAFRPPEVVLAARVAQVAAGATHVFARVRQKDLSQALRFL